ncbi:hypothetical protein [Luteolibacter sp. AS25]|uniref:hypothetical protein n=1 Tax=Luteolibacter sp. AS25 TaxID=3135776 RepID=UPI00398B8CE1
MMKSIFISLASVTALFTATSCSTQVDPPGDTSVETRVAEGEDKPGNILAEGRINTATQ